MPHSIPLAKPIYYKDQIKEIESVLESGWLTQGPNVSEFEKIFAKYCNSKYAVACCNGTSAIMLALKALGISKGDEVILPAITYISAPNAVVSCGGKPVFCDVNEDDLNISCTDLKRKLTKKTKAILPVHLYGCPVDLSEINKIASQENLVVVEDAAHAHGAEYKKKKIGGFNTTCFSFHPMKNMTSAEGGMVLTNNKDIAHKVQVLRSEGEEVQAWQRSGKRKYKKREFTRISLNYKMSDVHAAIGIVQLKHLDENNEKRKEIAIKYNKLLSNIPGVNLPKLFYPDKKQVFHLYTIKLENAKKRNKLLQSLRNSNIGCGIYFNPCYKESVYKGTKEYSNVFLPTSEKISNQILSIPMHPMLSEQDIQTVAHNIKEFCLKNE